MDQTVDIYTRAYLTVLQGDKMYRTGNAAGFAAAAVEFVKYSVWVLQYKNSAGWTNRFLWVADCA